MATIDDYLDDDGFLRDKIQLPKSLGACTDLYHEVRELRLAMEKQVENGMKALESALNKHLIDNLSSSDDTGVAGKRYRSQVKTETVYAVDTSPDANGWEKIHNWIARHKRFDFLEKRLSSKAVADYYEQNPDERLPGIERKKIKKLSVTKI